MRSIGNSWPELGQTPTLRRGRQTALVVIGVAAIASVSVISSLIDATATRSVASFVPVRAMVTEERFSPAPTAEGNQGAAASPSTIAPAVRQPLAAPAQLPRQANQKSNVWNDREWWKGDRQRRSRSAYWQRSAHARVSFPGSISSER